MAMVKLLYCAEQNRFLFAGDNSDLQSLIHVIFSEVMLISNTK